MRERVGWGDEKVGRGERIKSGEGGEAEEQVGSGVGKENVGKDGEEEEQVRSGVGKEKVGRHREEVERERVRVLGGGKGGGRDVSQETVGRGGGRNW